MFSLYGLLIGVAVVVGVSIAEYIDRRVSKAFPWVVAGGLVGARVYHLIDYSDYYLANLEQIVAIWNGGLGIWGGVIGGAIALIVYQRLNMIKEGWRMVGAIAIALPISQAIGRVGNYLNGEFTNQVGWLSWWGIEAGLNLILFGILWRLHKRGLSSQRIVGSYFVGYGSIRFWLEFWRNDSWKLGELGVAQWISIISIVIGLWLWQQQNVQE